MIVWETGPVQARVSTSSRIMPVQTFDPESISMTESAVAHLRTRMRGTGAVGVRLAVSEKGCNGFMYELGLVESEPQESLCFGESLGIRLFVDPEDAELLKGTEIDLVTEGLNSTLKFQNPNAETLCGCGESFSLRGT